MSEPRPAPPLTIQLFGGFQARRNGVSLPGLRLREGERLLAYLTLRAGEPMTPWELAKRFWPAEAQGNPPSGPGDFPSVRQALHSLRQALGPDADRLTRPNRGAVRLDLAGAEVDVLAFDRLVRAEGATVAADYASAAALHRGPLLDGWPETWAAEARAQRRHQYENVLRRLAGWAGQDGRWEEAERWLRLLLASRPGDEEAGRDLLRLLGTAGRHTAVRETLERITQAARAAGRDLEPDTALLGEELRLARKSEPPPPATPPGTGADSAGDAAPGALEAPGGAVPIGSRFYVTREADAQFHAALGRGDSVVLVKGARQVGKTSLLARGLQRAREAGAKVVRTDLQKLNAEQLASPDAFYRTLATGIARQLGLAVSPRDVWEDEFGPNMNMETFLCGHVLPALSEPLVWGLDEVDRLFSCPFGGEVFGLFRSWHNDRSLDPSSPLARLTLAIAYATEAQLFITDPNQSPFNIGTRLELADFTPGEAADLSRRYGVPWSEGDLARFRGLVGGQPYLVRLGLDRAAQGTPLERIEAEALGYDGLFGEHLRRLLLVLKRSPDEADALRGLLAGRSHPSVESFFRLRAAGILSGQSPEEARPRCRLYETFFARHLGPV